MSLDHGNTRYLQVYMTVLNRQINMKIAIKCSYLRTLLSEGTLTLTLTLTLRVVDRDSNPDPDHDPNHTHTFQYPCFPTEAGQYCGTSLLDPGSWPEVAQYFRFPPVKIWSSVSSEMTHR